MHARAWCMGHRAQMRACRTEPGAGVCRWLALMSLRTSPAGGAVHRDRFRHACRAALCASLRALALALARLGGVHVLGARAAFLSFENQQKNRRFG